jgi:phosphoribosyl-AMP cyclohydrolase
MKRIPDSASFLDALNFSSHGILPAVIQDHENGQVLMLGYMNREAAEKTLQGPHVTFYSRSRKKLWTKGETSGHFQTVKQIFFDCDADALLIKVEQKVAACHAGYRSCFFREMGPDGIRIVGEKIFEPEDE